MPTDTHAALYLTYRPQSFDDVAGQAPVVVTLKRALSSGRVSHAYLFTGPRGTGKTTTARLLAKGINCAKPAKDGEPCGKCDSCQAIAAGSDLDLIEIDAASNRGIDEIRELREKVAVAPTRSPRKVYLIDEVHMLTKEAFNALLKTLEEPPDHVVFILATTEPEKVPQTIISRCQRFDFRPASGAAVAVRLNDVAKREKITLDPVASELIARQAGGSFRDALSILDLLVASGSGKITPRTVQETLGLAGQEHLEALESALVAGDRVAALAAIRTATDEGVAPDTFRTDFIALLRRRLRAHLGAEPATPEDEPRVAAWDTARLVAAITAVTAAGDAAADSPVPELPLELAALHFLADRPDATSASSDNKDQSTKPGASEKKASDSPPRAARREPTSSAGSSGAKQKAAPKRSAAAPAKPPRDAQEIWEKLLEATKNRYSLSVSLQRTRPKKLEKTKLHLSVLSEFFLKKLEHQKTREEVEAECRKLLGRKVAVEYSLAPPDEEDVFEGALSTFEGAEVHGG